MARHVHAPRTDAPAARGANVKRLLAAITKIGWLPSALGPFALLVAEEDSAKIERRNRACEMYAAALLGIEDQRSKVA